MVTIAKDLTSIRLPVNQEEEALKRNTDCVYFLASPLTCKKGAGCEFRHSETARVNPRDCWYWLEGRCLNINCSFRHPPLEGLLVSPTTPLGSSLPPDLASTSKSSIPAASATQNPNKQNIPCHYFNKGLCLKGDKCHFLHGPSKTNNPSLLQMQNFSRQVTDKIQTQTVRTTSWNLNKCNSQQHIPNTAGEIDQSSAVVSAVEHVNKDENLPASGFTVGKIKVPTELNKKILPKPHPLSASTDACHPIRKNIATDKKVHESSHGSGLPLHVKDNYMDYSGKNSYGSDYIKSVGDPFEESRDCNQQARSYDQYDHKNRRVSREVSPERNISRRDVPDQIGSSDLRLKLQKHRRRLNGSASATVSDRHEQSGYMSSRYQKDHFHHEEISIGKRLQGRITIPGRTITGDSLNGYARRDMENSKNWDRTSPEGSSIYQRRLTNRLGHRMLADLSADERNHSAYVPKQRIPHVREPHNIKKLTDWKDLNGYDKSERRSTKTSYESPSREHNHKEVDTSSFDGPKSLSEILKRKRGMSSGNSDISSYDEEDHQKFGKRKEMSSSMYAVSSNKEFSGNETLNLDVADQSVVRMNHSSRADNENHTLDNVEESENFPVEEEEGLIHSDVEEQPVLEFSGKEQVLEIEGEMMVEDMDGSEFENYEQGAEEYDYEKIEGEEDFTLENENAYEYNEEDLNDEESDFTEKVDVMYS